MKVIVLVILSLLVSCGPSIQCKDSILNYKGGGNNIKNNMFRVLCFQNTNV